MSHDQLKGRVRQVFTYLQALVQQKYPAIRQISDQPFSYSLSNLPFHESIRFSPNPGDETPILEIQRPNLVPCPEPQPTVLPWLKEGWDSSAKEVSIYEKRLARTNDQQDGKELYELFTHSHERVAAFEQWKNARDIWAEERLRAEAAQKIFELFYEQFVNLEKEGGQLELVVGDGFLNWRIDSGGIAHPILLKRVELKFDDKVPSFSLYNSTQPVELYNALLLSINEVDARLLQQRALELKESQFHPLSTNDTSGYLRALVQSIAPTGGIFLDSNPRDGEKDVPRIWRAPMVFSRRRTTAFSLAIERILEDIEHTETFSQSFAAITGLHDLGGRSASDSAGIAELNLHSNELDENQILLAKEANPQQINIVKRLAENGRVHVQGPPGTGKTHTIGNIIGHLLAHGKRILVTSHTEKALKVLKEHVPKELQSLCVPVLAGDTETRRQLESSINAISERVTGRYNAEDLFLKANHAFKERGELLNQEKSAKALLRGILDAEYNSLEIDGQSLEPSEAAREIATTRTGNDWIPGECLLSDPLPLTPEEFHELYATNALLTETDEADLGIGILDYRSILPPDELEVLLSEYRRLLQTDLEEHKEYWRIGSTEYQHLETAANNLLNEFSDELLSLGWRPAAIAAGMTERHAKSLWLLLCSRIEEAVAHRQQLSKLAHLSPAIEENADLEQLLQTLTEMQSYVQEGKSLSYLKLIINTKWKACLELVEISAGKPHRVEHFEALILLTKLRLARCQIKPLWDDLVAENGGTPFDKLGAKPESKCSALVPEIKRSITWYEQVWVPLRNDLSKHGLDWDRVDKRIPRQISATAGFLHIQTLSTRQEHLPRIFASELNRRRMRDLETSLKALTRNFNESPLGQQFATSIHTRDLAVYKDCYVRLRHLQQLEPYYARRVNLIKKLQARNPEWAGLIQNRIPPHGDKCVPGEIQKAWRWKRINCELDKRGKDSLAEILARLERLRERVKTLTSELIENLAWGRQVKLVRDNPRVHQSLVGWLDVKKRQQSQRNQALRAKLSVAAQEALADCSTAVPVWIMPLSAVAENLDPRQTKFDVVIIDEASQATLMALIPLYMAKEAIIVGDHEQTSPEAVGIEQLPIQKLIDVHLQGIPNSTLFDHLTSVYDVAKRSFGNTHMLTEHFRCVPDIIGFSNKLAYDNHIKPLREASSSNLIPPTIAYRVNGTCLNKVNEVEAESIAKLIEAMTRHKAYSNKSIGVITLLGDEQGKIIDAKIRSRLKASEYLSRKIVCGTPPQFQGDEKDVIFLSIVDSIGSDEDAFLARKGDGPYGAIKKRYNVAASRAKDQLWVIHSIDSDRNLKPGDLRRELIQFARNPKAYLDVAGPESVLTESLFEKLVLEDLTAQGYRVRPQWKVGYYRIDMVVMGLRERLAVECDGDRFHGPEKREDDLERQAVLERLGWKFVRIRGTSFFRDRSTAMKPVYDKLERLGIEKLRQTENGLESGDDMTLVRDLERMAFSESLHENL